MRKTFLSLLVVIVCAGRYAIGAELANSYFPLNDGAAYTYRGVFDGTEYMDTVVIRSHYLPTRTKIYYFTKADDEVKINPIIGVAGFGLGTYFHEEDGLYTIEAFFKSEVSEINYSQKQRLLSTPLVQGESHKLVLPSSLVQDKTNELVGRQFFPFITVTVMGFEDVTVPAGTFNDCALIRWHEHWEGGEEYTGYVWLAKNVGAVKWHKATGRIDELVHYDPAN